MEAPIPHVDSTPPMGKVDDDHLRGGSRWHNNRGCGSRGCSSVSSVIGVIILMVILSHLIKSGLSSYLHDQLIMGLNHSV
jgi:hypothetical protein